MSTSAPPISMPFDLGSVSDHGAEITLRPSAPERTAIAAWLGAESVERLEASIRLTRLADERYRYAARFSADVIQACVVTLEPLSSHLEGEVERDFQVMRALPRRLRAEIHDSGPPDDGEEGPEILETPIIDLAAPVLEELSLSLDPYPRAPGVAFEPPKDDAGASSSPFAVLAKLKERQTDKAQKSPQAPPKAPKAKPKA